MRKPYELGISVGRYQTFHNGHKYMLDKALELCERVGVFIGSSQESMTYKNPFSYELRAELLRKVYGDRLYIFPLPDIGVGNTAKWGDYVIDNAVERFGILPDILISGREERRADWLDGERGLGVAELYVPKIIDISATRMREFFLMGDKESWMEYTDPALWPEFDRLRFIVLASQINRGTASI